MNNDLSDSSITERAAGARPEGRAGHLTDEQRHAIRMAYLETGGTITRVALAERFNVNRDTVGACLGARWP